MADIIIHLMKSRNTVPAVEGLSLELNENQFYIVAGEIGATTFEIDYHSDYNGYDFYVEMVNAKGQGINRTKLENNSSAEWVISDTEFYLPLGMAVAGYAQISITAEDGQGSLVVFMPVKVPVQNTIPEWKTGVDQDTSLFIANGHLYYESDGVTKDLGQVQGDAGAQGRGFTMRGEWNVSTSYVADDENIDVVMWNNKAYYCKVSNSTQNPESSSAYWGLFASGAGFYAAGTWVAGHSYVNANGTIDVVQYNGNSYYCKVSTSGSISPDSDTSHWGIFASGGIERGKSGYVTISAGDWSSNAVTLTISDLGANDAITFTGATRADDAAMSSCGVFVNPVTSANTVIVTCLVTPDAALNLYYFITRGVA